MRYTVMKTIHFICLLLFLTVFLLITPGNAYGKNNPKKFKPGNDNSNNNNNANHNNNDNIKDKGNNHQERRYKYHDQDYNFHDYYHFYSVENNVFTYEGAYGQYGDIFIFTDRYGNEFDLYIQPVQRTPRWFRGYPLQEGNAYNIRLNPTKMYPRREDVQLGISFNFGWGNLTMHNDEYFDMYNAPELVNIRGQLYFKGRN
jgi:hypothetical protein